MSSRVIETDQCDDRPRQYSLPILPAIEALSRIYQSLTKNEGDVLVLVLTFSLPDWICDFLTELERAMRVFANTISKSKFVKHYKIYRTKISSEFNMRWYHRIKYPFETNARFVYVIGETVIDVYWKKIWNFVNGGEVRIITAPFDGYRIIGSLLQFQQKPESVTTSDEISVPEVPYREAKGLIRDTLKNKNGNVLILISNLVYVEWLDRFRLKTMSQIKSRRKSYIFSPDHLSLYIYPEDNGGSLEMVYLFGERRLVDVYRKLVCITGVITWKCKDILELIYPFLKSENTDVIMISPKMGEKADTCDEK